jgi:hypothetical protein
MAASVGVKVTVDDAAMRDMFAAVEALARTSTTVGYHEPTPVPDSGLDVPTLALIQEYGTAKIPARPFMRNGAKAAIPLLVHVAGDEIAKVVLVEQSAVRAFVAIGDAAAGRVLEQLETAGAWAKPNAPYTLKKKAPYTTPLYAGHGRLKDELKFAVLDRDHQLLLEKPT